MPLTFLLATIRVRFVLTVSIHLQIYDKENNSSLVKVSVISRKSHCFIASGNLWKSLIFHPLIHLQVTISFLKRFWTWKISFLKFTVKILYDLWKRGGGKGERKEGEFWSHGAAQMKTKNFWKKLILTVIHIFIFFIWFSENTDY